MFIRKIVKSGLASYTVALPKEWILKHHLEKGDMIYLDETKESDLLVTVKQAQELKQEEQISINIDKKDERSIRTDIIAGYLNNYQQVTLFGKNLSQFVSLIKETSASLIGMEVIEEDSNKIVLRSFVHLGDALPEPMIRRIDNIVRSMIIDAKQIPKNSSLVEAIRERDVSVNRFVYLMFKVVKASLMNPNVASQLKLKPTDALFLWEMSMHLEKIGDGIKRTGKNIQDLSKNNKASLQVIRIWEDFQKLYETAMLSFYKLDPNAADSCTAARDELVKKAAAFAEEHKTIAAAELSAKIRAMVSHITDITRFARYTR